MNNKNISMNDVIGFIDAADRNTLDTLNRLVVSRARQLRANAVVAARGKFQRGDRVIFKDRSGHEVHGLITAIRSTTAIVLDDVRNFFPDTPRQWRVGLDLLRREA